jgi:hypothetical protein
LLVFADSKATGTQDFKDELERLKPKPTAHITEKLTLARVQCIRQLIVANVKQGKTEDDAMELFSILEALIKQTVRGVSLTDFPDLAFGEVASDLFRQALPLKGMARSRKLQDLRRQSPG